MQTYTYNPNTRDGRQLANAGLTLQASSRDETPGSTWCTSPPAWSLPFSGEIVSTPLTQSLWRKYPSTWTFVQGFSSLLYKVLFSAFHFEGNLKQRADSASPRDQEQFQGPRMQLFEVCVLEHTVPWAQAVILHLEDNEKRPAITE